MNVLTLFKSCTDCGEAKTADQFRYHNRVCKSCVAVQKKKWLRKNKERVKEQRKEYISLPRAKILRRLAALKARCKRKGIKFDLQPHDVVVPNNCPVLGVLLNGDSRSPFCATIDKIIPAKGYVRDNIVVVSKRANQIKSDASLEEIARVLSYYSQLM